jgi:acetyl esterase/lipase
MAGRTKAPRGAWRIVALTAALWSLAACSGTGLLNSVARLEAPVARDVRYGDLPRHTLDIYPAAGVNGADAPLLVFFHGGSWQYGDKADYRFLGAALAARGVETAVVNYRLHPEVIHPGFVEDAARAVAHLHRTRAQGRPMFLAGHSAGAHIAALVAADPRHLAAQGLHVCAVARGLIGIAGPYDFTPVEPVFKAIFPPDRLADSKPINFAANPLPPTLLLHGSEDDTVAPKRSEEFAAALTRAGNQATLKRYDGVGHILIVGAFSPLVRAAAPTLSDVVEFVTAESARTGPACVPPPAPPPAGGDEGGAP